MKKLIYSLVIVLAVFTSCNKEDGSSDLQQPSETGEQPIPSSFGKKILVEEYCGAWCGYCPYGAYMLDSLSTQVYPGQLIGVAIHVSTGPPGSEVMECPQLYTMTGNALGDFFNAPGGVPAGTIDRDTVANPVFWPYQIPGKVGLFPSCGFYIDASSVSGNSMSVTVHTGFAASLFGDYRLNVFVVENDVHNAGDPEYDQNNYYSQTGSSPDPSLVYYYNLPPSINDFHHMNVLRQLLTEVPFGDKVPQDQMVKGNHYKTTYAVNLTGINKANAYVVAFLDKYSPVPTTDPMHPQHQVQNVQRVKVGSVSSWN